MEITFETLPKQVHELHAKLDAIRLLLESSEANAGVNSDRLMTIKEASSFLELSSATIYLKVSKREIPFSKKGKRLYFLKHDLIEWIKQGSSFDPNETGSGLIQKKKGGKR